MNEFQRIRLVAIDLDGTLLSDAKEVSQATADALRCLGRSDVKVVIASARPPRSVRHFYNLLKLDTWQINYNGALVWDEPRREAVFHRPMEPQLVRAIVESARAFDPRMLVSCEILDKWYTDAFDEGFAAAHTTETGRLFKPDVVAPVESFCDRPITKLMLLGDDGLIGDVEPILQEKHGTAVSIIRSDSDLLQIMDRRCSKAAALRLVATHYEAPMDHVMAIGDAANDIDMLEAAGVAVAVDNADPRTKAAADWVAPSNNDHGVHAALRRYGLCE